MTAVATAQPAHAGAAGRLLGGGRGAVPFPISVPPFSQMGPIRSAPRVHAGNMRGVHGRLKQADQPALFWNRVIGFQIGDTQNITEVAHHRQLAVIAPTLPQCSIGLADVDQKIVGNSEIDTGTIWKKSAIFPEYRWQVEHVFEGLNSHRAHRHSVSARRRSRTIRLLRLRSSSFAHAVSPACRSGDNRTKSPTTFSAMSPVYMCYSLATIVANCYYSSTVLLLAERVSQEVQTLTRLVAPPARMGVPTQA